MKRNEKAGIAFGLYLKSGGKRSKSSIAKEIGVAPGTVSLWAKKDSWDNMLNCADKASSDCQLADNGLLPDDTRQIIDLIESSSGAQILRQNILLQYAAIIKAQKLMDPPSEENTEKSKKEDWEKYKVFLDTQSKAMSALTSMLIKYDDYRRNGLEDEALTAKIDLLKKKSKALSDKSDGSIRVVSNVPRGDEEEE